MKQLEQIITDIIQRAIDKGEHGSPAAAYARQVLAAVEQHYDEARPGLFKGRQHT